VGAGVGALIGAVEDFTVQLLQNGDDLQCVDGGSIATSAAIGALPLGSALGIPSKTGRLRSFLGRFVTKKAGDLTSSEIRQIQKVVNEAGCPLEVVGSAAKGTRRGGLVAICQ